VEGIDGIGTLESDREETQHSRVGMTRPQARSKKPMDIDERFQGSAPKLQMLVNAFPLNRSYAPHKNLDNAAARLSNVMQFSECNFNAPMVIKMIQRRGGESMDQHTTVS
jgi:hypothetical protein